MFKSTVYLHYGVVTKHWNKSMKSSRILISYHKLAPPVSFKEGWDPGTLADLSNCNMNIHIKMKSNTG